MKTITKKLSTGITTKQYDKGGRIEVLSDYYDDRFDYPTVDSIYKEDLFNTLANIFKPN